MSDVSNFKFEIEAARLADAFKIALEADDSPVVLASEDGLEIYSQCSFAMSIVARVEFSDFLYYECDTPQMFAIDARQLVKDFKSEKVAECTFKQRPSSKELQRLEVKFGRMKSKYPLLTLDTHAYAGIAREFINKFERLRAELSTYFYITNKDFKELHELVKKCDLKDPSSAITISIGESVNLRAENSNLYIVYDYTINGDELIELEVSDDSYDGESYYTAMFMDSAMRALESSSQTLKVYYGVNMPIIMVSEDESVLAAIAPRVPTDEIEAIKKARVAKKVNKETKSG